MKNILLYFGSLLAQCVFAQPTATLLSFPESVASDGSRYFVSNIGTDPFARDGNGFISEITADGALLTLNLFPQAGILNAPKGMAVLNGILYTADLDRVVGFDLNTKQRAFELAIPGTTLLNDICLLENDDIGVTESVNGNIYRINTKKKTYDIIGNVPFVNGISFNKKTGQVAVCSIGKTYGEGSVYLAQRTKGALNFEALPGIEKGFFDGIEWMDGTHLLISDWVTYPVKGFAKIWVYDLKKRNSEMLLCEESAADIFYEAKSGRIFIPLSLHDKIVVTSLAQLKTSMKK